MVVTTVVVFPGSGGKCTCGHYTELSPPVVDVKTDVVPEEPETKHIGFRS